MTDEARVCVVDHKTAATRPPPDRSTLLGAASARRPLGTGVHVANYRIVRRIGRGATGVVYHAEHRVTGGKFALKLLRPELANNDAVVSRFLAEASTCARVEHPGVVRIFDAVRRRDGTAYLVMELIEGSLMSRVVRDRRLSIRAAVNVARHIAVTLAAAHKAGIVHRDLKPSNIFIQADPWEPAITRVKIIDFGIAKFFLERPDLKRTFPGSLMGTPAFMSPEQATGSPTLDSRSDIYSLGCILYEALCGRTPFIGSLADVLRGHVGARPIEPRHLAPQIPVPLSSLVLRMLAKRPADRPTTMPDVDSALYAIGKHLERSER